MKILTHSLRVLSEKPVVTAAAIIILALGIGVNTVIFSVAKAVLLNPIGYREPDRLVTIAATTPAMPENERVDPFTVRDWRTQCRSLESMSIYSDASTVLIENGRAEIVRGLRVSYEFVDTLGISMERGRSFLPEEDRPERRSTVVILSYGTWIRRFAADPHIIGRVLQFGDSRYTVVGVLPANFPTLLHGTTELLPEIYMPLGYDFFSQCRTCEGFRVIARLRQGVHVGETRTELNAIMHNIAREHPTDYVQSTGVSVEPLRNYVFGRVRKPLWMVLGGACFVFLIACTNVAGLLLARAAGRSKELALRAALGATRLDLICQLLSEATVLSLAGGTLGVLIALVGTRPLVSLLPTQIPRIDEVHTDGTVLFFTIIMSLLTAVLCGIAPALRASRADLNELLKAATNPGDLAHPNVGDALIIAELALAFILAVGAGLMVKSFVRLTEVSLGYDPHNIFTLTTDVWSERYWDQPDAAIQYYAKALERVRATPGVESAAWTSVLPLDYGVREHLQIEGRAIASRSEAVLVDSYSVSRDYFRVMKIPLKRGRFFDVNDVPKSPKVALISELCARNEFPGEDPIGKRIQLQGDERTKEWATVVGVVGDVRQYALDRAPEMAVYLSQEQSLAVDYYRLVARTTLDPRLCERSVKDAFTSVDANLPVYHIKTLEDYLSGTLAPRTVAMMLLGLFSTLALVLASVGVYGLTSYAVAVRTHEIGIRMALGATPNAILLAALTKGLALAGIGIAIGIGVSLMLTRLLAALLFGVRTVDLPTYATVSVVLISVALLATYSPARRAAAIDPMDSLREQ